jgi:hypothetical protein
MDQFEDLGVHRRIILKCIFKKYEERGLDLAQDRGTRKVLANAEMKPRISYNARNALTGTGTPTSAKET